MFVGDEVSYSMVNKRFFIRCPTVQTAFSLEKNFSSFERFHKRKAYFSFFVVCIRCNIKGEKADPWIRVDPRGSAWISVDPHVFPWVPLDLHGSPRIPVDLGGSACIPMGLLGSPWVASDPRGSPWIPVDPR